MVDQIIGSAPFVYEGDFAQGVAKARELGYDGVELHIADPADVDLPTLEQALAENSMRLTAIGTGRAYVNHGRAGGRLSSGWKLSSNWQGGCMQP